MADGGRYRRRQFAVAALTGNILIPQAHQAHFQRLDDNPLNGGIERWFAPAAAETMRHEVMGPIIALRRDVFDLDRPEAPLVAWRVELHQFRIEAYKGERWLPTPEGIHRDGVDWVLVRRSISAAKCCSSRGVWTWAQTCSGVASRCVETSTIIGARM